MNTASAMCFSLCGKIFLVFLLEQMDQVFDESNFRCRMGDGELRLSIPNSIFLLFFPLSQSSFEFNLSSVDLGRIKVLLLGSSSIRADLL